MQFFWRGYITNTMEPQSQEHPSSPQIDLLDSSSPSRKTTSESYDDDDDPLVHSVSRNLSSDTPSVKSLSLTPEERNTPRSATGSPVTRTSRQQRSNTASFIGHQLTSSTCFYDIPVVMGQDGGGNKLDHDLFYKVGTRIEWCVLGTPGAIRSFRLPTSAGDIWLDRGR